MVRVELLVTYRNPQSRSQDALRCGARLVDRKTYVITVWYVVFGTFPQRVPTTPLDMFEVAVLVAACFLVNYVTSDAKTNWAEGQWFRIFLAPTCKI